MTGGAEGAETKLWARTSSEPLEGLLAWRRAAQTGSRGPRSSQGDSLCGRAPLWNGLAIGGVRGWLRLAGGDNAIRMIQGDLAGSEQSVVRVRANRWLVAEIVILVAQGGPVGS